MDRRTLAEFKKRFHLANKFARDEFDQESLILGFQFRAEEGTRTSLKLPPDPELGRLALLIRPFADPDSGLFFEKLSAAYLESKHCDASAEQRIQLAGRAQQVRRGQTVFRLNGEVLDGPALYTIYALGGYLDERPEQKATSDAIAHSPMGPGLPKFLFFSYCLDVLDFCRLLYSVFRCIEGRIDDPAEPPADPQCIYCRCTDGSFSSEEHVYPESIGNTEIILAAGTVCDQCNNGSLSDLDNHLVNHDLVAFLRTVFLPLNPKTGRYPKGTSQNIHFEKRGPRHIKVRLHGMAKHKADQLVTKDTETGEVRISLPMVGKKRFDPIMLGRALFKIALGAVAYHQGRDACLDPRYDLARAFVLGERGFPNQVLIAKACKPVPKSGATYQQFSPGTPFQVSLFGVQFLFNIEEQPQFAPMPPELESEFFSFPLFTDEADQQHHR